MLRQPNETSRFRLLPTLICLLGVLALALDLCGAEEKSPEQLEEERKRLMHVLDTYKSLYRREKQLEPEEALKLLQTLNSVQAGELMPQSIYERPIKVEKLLEYANVNEEKCADRDIVLEMRRDYDLAKKQLPALLPYVSTHFIAQFEMCGFHIKYREDWKNFRETHKVRYGKMVAFKDRVAKFGKISKDWRGKKLDNPLQYNAAFTDMYQDKKRATKSGGRAPRHRGDAAIEAYNEMHEILDGARMWKKDVSPNMEFATHHPNAMQDEELKDGLRHNNVFNQALRTNYGRSMGSMFADAYYDKDDRHWQGYESWRDMWV